MTKLPKEVQDKLKAKLLEDKKRIETRSAELRSQDPFRNPDRLNDNAASDMEASEEEGHDRAVAMTEELGKEKVRIEDALDRMLKGTYGVCANCGNDIEVARLEIVPTATLCLSCEQGKQA